MKKILISLMLAGCAGKTVYKPVEIEVPVAMPCTPPPMAHTVWPTKDLTEKSAFFDQVKALIAENELRQAYEAKLEASIAACR